MGEIARRRRAHGKQHEGTRAAKRIYDPRGPRRWLPDPDRPHLAARGVRERARLDEWARELAPSGELRKWFDHDPDRFAEFRARYRDELAAEPGAWRSCAAAPQTAR